MKARPPYIIASYLASHVRRTGILVFDKKFLSRVSAPATTIEEHEHFVIQWAVEHDAILEELYHPVAGRFARASL